MEGWPTPAESGFAMDLLIKSNLNGSKVMWEFPNDVGYALCHAFPETFARHEQRTPVTQVQFFLRPLGNDDRPRHAICRRVLFDGKIKEESFFDGFPWLARANFFNGECPEELLRGYAQSWRSAKDVVSQAEAAEIAAWIQKGRPV